MGTAKVMLKTDEHGHPIIEKCPVGDVEFTFYQHAAKALNQAGIATPTLMSADATLRKLRMEYIPHPIEQAAIANDDVLTTLARLHRYPPNYEWLYHAHSWSTLALEKSLILLALPDKSAQQLRRFQQCSDVLFGYQSLVFGDSNVGNRGRRENGDVVLFDWERFGTGSPAIDLAPLIKGMGTRQSFTDLAKRYCQLACHHHYQALAREIAIAKAWIVSEVMILLAERQKTTFSLYLNWYKEHLPDWLDNSEEML